MIDPIVYLDLQPTGLKNELVTLAPLDATDFERLYKVACDPLIWEQHPDKYRYQRPVFEKFFEGAIQSKGAFIVLDTTTNEAIGSSRFYDYDATGKTVLIGYTFLARQYWGNTYNRAMKYLMINHAFQFVEHIFFEIGTNNIRSQKAIQKLGAIKWTDREMPGVGEAAINKNERYGINKANWLAII